MAGKWLAQTPGSVSAGWGNSSAAAVGCQYIYICICMYVHIYTHFEYLGFEWPIYSDFWSLRTAPLKKYIIIICDWLCPKRKITASSLGLSGVKELSSAFAYQVVFWRKVGNVHAICFLLLSVLGNHTWPVKNELLHYSNIYLLYCITLMILLFLILHYTSYY